MKKSLIIAGLVAFLATTTASYAATTQTQTNLPKKPVCEKAKAPHMNKDKKPDRPTLDEKLNLTDEQKAKAHDIRMHGHEKIKPVMEKIKAKHQEIKKVIEDESLTQEQKDNKIFAIEKDLLNLKQQARKIRTENMKKFEEILTDEQKAELEKIKKEARERRAKEPQGQHRPMPLNK